MMTLDAIITECEASGCFAAYRVPSRKVPIPAGGEIVGFYAPARRAGAWCLGYLYIARPYRRQGHALRTVRDHVARHPRASFFAINSAAERLAQRAGLRFVRRHSSGAAIYVATPIHDSPR